MADTFEGQVGTVVQAVTAAAIQLQASSKQMASTATETSEKTTPIRLEVVTRLDFDKLIVADGGPGDATLRPDGERRASGSVSSVSMRAMVGEIVIRGEPGRLVRVELPRALDLIGANGGTLRLDSLVSDLPSMPQLDSSGELHIRFGGDVHVSPGVDGNFRGDVAIVVDYI